MESIPEVEVSVPLNETRTVSKGFKRKRLFACF